MHWFNQVNYRYVLGVFEATFAYTKWVEGRVTTQGALIFSALLPVLLFGIGLFMIPDGLRQAIAAALVYPFFHLVALAFWNLFR